MVYSSYDSMYDSMYDHINYGLYLLTVVKMFLFPLTLENGYADLKKMFQLTKLKMILMFIVFDVLWILLKYEDIIVFDWFSNFEIIYLLSSFVLSIIFFNDRFCKNISKRKLFLCLLFLIFGIYLLINNLYTLYDEFNYYSLSLSILIILLCSWLIIECKIIINKISYDSLQYYQFICDLMDNVRPDESKLDLLLNLSKWLLCDENMNDFKAQRLKNAKTIEDIIKDLKEMSKDLQDESVWDWGLRKIRRELNESQKDSFLLKFMKLRGEICFLKIRGDVNIMNEVRTVRLNIKEQKRRLKMNDKYGEYRDCFVLLQKDLKEKVRNLDDCIKTKYSGEYDFLSEFVSTMYREYNITIKPSVAELIILSRHVLYDELYYEVIEKQFVFPSEDDVNLMVLISRWLLDNTDDTDDVLQGLIKELSSERFSLNTDLKDTEIWESVLRNIKKEWTVEKKNQFSANACIMKIKNKAGVMSRRSKICQKINGKF